MGRRSLLKLGTLDRVVHINDCSDVAKYLVAELSDLIPDVRLTELRVRPRPGAPVSGPPWSYSTPVLAAERLGLGLAYRSRVRRADLLHIHYGMFGAIGLLSGIPYVLHFHGSDLLVDHEHRFYRELNTRSARAAVLCLVSTPDLLRFAEPLGTELRFLPNPAPPPVRADEDPRPGRVLFAAKVDRAKSPDVFLEAALGLAQRGVSVAVLGFGDVAERYRQQLEAIQGAGADVFWERLESDAFGRLMQTAAIVVGQFGVGSFGMTELAAFGGRKPVVTHFRFPRAYGTAPAYVEAADAREIASAVGVLLGDASLRDSVGGAAEEWVEREHGKHTVALRLKGLYEEVL